MKKFISLFLSVVLVLSLISGVNITAFASSGKCGNNLYYEIDDNTLHIWGEGAMNNYASAETKYYSSCEQAYDGLPYTVYNCSAPWANEDFINVVIDEGVTSIGNMAFYNNSIYSVSLPASLKELGWHAFRKAPNRVCINDMAAFFNINHITENYHTVPDFNNDEVYYPNLFGKDTELFVDNVLTKKVVVPEGVTTINSYTFKDFAKLESIYFADSVEKVCKGALWGCNNLTTIGFGKNICSFSSNVVQYYDDLYGINYIAPKINTVSINDYDSWCNLTEEKFAVSLFKNAIKLYKNEQITSVELTERATRLCDYSFYNCTYLNSIYIPKTVTTINYYSLWNCANLKTIAIYNPECKIAANSIPLGATIYGYANSTAQTFANNYNIDFETIDKLPVSPVQEPEQTTVEENAEWVQQGNNWYYLYEGSPVIGWEKINGEWYYFDNNGAMRTGWLRNGGYWYYLDTTGIMLTGWVKDGNTWYYIGHTGAMTTGWQKVRGYWYYMTSSGAMKTGWIKVSKKWYYLEPSGRMRTASLKYKGKVYYFNTSGACINP